MVQVRAACAFNLPAIALVFSKLRWTDKAAAAVTTLSRDPSTKVSVPPQQQRPATLTPPCSVVAAEWWWLSYAVEGSGPVPLRGVVQCHRGEWSSAIERRCGCVSVQV